MSIKMGGFIREQAQKLCEKLTCSGGGPQRSERQPEARTGETGSDLILFMGDGGFRELEEIARGIGISVEEAKRVLERLANEDYAQRGYKLTDKSLQFVGVIQNIRKLPPSER